eukprot:scpid94725/ scgid31266/ 
MYSTDRGKQDDCQRTSRFPSQSARRPFVQAVVTPDITYGSKAFFPTLLGRQVNSLGLLQNRDIRAIDGHPPYTPMHPLPTRHGSCRISEVSKRILPGGASSSTRRLGPRCLDCSSD